MARAKMPDAPVILGTKKGPIPKDEAEGAIAYFFSNCTLTRPRDLRVVAVRRRQFGHVEEYVVRREERQGRARVTHYPVGADKLEKFLAER